MRSYDILSPCNASVKVANISGRPVLTYCIKYVIILLQAIRVTCMFSQKCIGRARNVFFRHEKFAVWQRFTTVRFDSSPFCPWQDEIRTRISFLHDKHFVFTTSTFYKEKRRGRGFPAPRQLFTPCLLRDTVRSATASTASPPKPTQRTQRGSRVNLRHYLVFSGGFYVRKCCYNKRKSAWPAF